MKNNDQKYEEAMERNFANAERDKKNGCSKYRGVGLINVFLAMGVREGDTRFNERIKELVKG